MNNTDTMYNDKTYYEMDLGEFKKAVEYRLLELSNSNITWVNGCLAIRNESIWEDIIGISQTTERSARKESMQLLEE